MESRKRRRTLCHRLFGASRKSRKWVMAVYPCYRGMWLQKLGFTFLLFISLLIMLMAFDDFFRNSLGYGKEAYNVPAFLVESDISSLNCKYLFNGNKTEIQRAKYRMVNGFDFRTNVDDSYIIEGTKNCSKFIENRGYVMNVSQEEENFPIAFSIVLYKDAAQAERLLRAVYRPSNYYCIHVDAKATSSVHRSMKKLTECFDNVNMATRSLDVVWGAFSVLEAELVCMSDLLRRKKWKYFINLTGQEYPLKTNLQLVRVLKAYNGANDIDATVSRYWENIRRWWLAGYPPHGIRPVLGSVHIIANRHFVDYAVNHPVAKDLLDWVRGTAIPDETFFSTLNHNPQLGIPGSYVGVPETDPVKKPFLARYKIWDNGFLFLLDDCQGKWVHHICIFGVGDLPRFVHRNELFANKFHIDFEPIVYECMEERYFTMVKQEEGGRLTFDDTYYRSVGFVVNQVSSKSKYQQL